jgi:hypothetical protein
VNRVQQPSVAFDRLVQGTTHKYSARAIATNQIPFYNDLVLRKTRRTKTFPLITPRNAKIDKSPQTPQSQSRPHLVFLTLQQCSPSYSTSTIAVKRMRRRFQPAQRLLASLPQLPHRAISPLHVHHSRSYSNNALNKLSGEIHVSLGLDSE